MVHHSTKDERVLLSRPANYHDMLQGLMLSRGVKPGELRPKGPKQLPRKAESQINVVGGKTTPNIEMVAAAWKRQGMAKHMAKRTGSDPEAVAWFLSHRVE